MKLKSFRSSGSARFLSALTLVLALTTTTRARTTQSPTDNHAQQDMNAIFPHDTDHALNPTNNGTLSMTDEGSHKAHLKKGLMLDMMDDPKYDELYSGKGILERQYKDMMEEGQDLNVKMQKDQDRLFDKYENFQKRRGEIKRRRNAALKKVLESASIGNHFLGNEQEARDAAPEVVMGNNGLEVKEPARDLREAKLMGMHNLHDLQHLNILKQLKQRHQQLKEDHEDLYKQQEAEESFNRPRERNLMQVAPGKSVKHLRAQVAPDSFLKRETKMGRGVFKSDTENRAPEERQLRIRKYVRRERSRMQHRRRKQRTRREKRNEPSWRDRKLNTAAKKTTTKKAKKKTSKSKKLKKKFKRQYSFNWKTLKWGIKKKYKFTLIKSLKDLKFWKAMGLKIKKHLPKLHYHDYSKRKYKAGQRVCLLIANFSPLMQNYYTYMVHFKVEFRSNCHDYIAEKVFSTNVHYWRGFKIQIGKMQFYLQYSWRYRYYGYFRIYEDIRIWPKYVPITFMPWKKRADLVRIGLVGKDALRWKPYQLKIFLQHGHKYPSMTVTQMLKAKKDKERRKILAEIARKQKIIDDKKKAAAKKAAAKKKKDDAAKKKKKSTTTTSSTTSSTTKRKLAMRNHRGGNRRSLRRRRRTQGKSDRRRRRPRSRRQHQVNRERKHRSRGRRLNTKRSRIHHVRKSHQNHHRQLRREFHPRYLMQMPNQPEHTSTQTPQERQLRQTKDGRPVIRESDFAREPEEDMFKNEIYPPFDPKFQMKPPTARVLRGKEYDPIHEYDPRPDVANDVREEMVEPTERSLKKIVSPTPHYFEKYGFRHVNSPEGFVIAKSVKKIVFLKKTVDFVFESASKIGRCSYGYYSHCTM